MADNDFAVLIIFIPPTIGPATRVADIEKAGDGELDTLRAPSLPVVFSVFPRLTFDIEVVGSHQLPSRHVSSPAIPW